MTQSRIPKPLQDAGYEPLKVRHSCVCGARTELFESRLDDCATLRCTNKNCPYQEVTHSVTTCSGHYETSETHLQQIYDKCVAEYIKTHQEELRQRKLKEMVKTTRFF